MLKVQCHIHYICSNLPAYQVDLFLNAKNYRNYICESCCGVLLDGFRVKCRSTEDDVWKERFEQIYTECEDLKATRRMARVNVNNDETQSKLVELLKSELESHTLISEGTELAYNTVLNVVSDKDETHIIVSLLILLRDQYNRSNQLRA